MTTTQPSANSNATQWIEEGAAAMALAELSPSAPKHAMPRRENFDVIVIGDGQADLSVGYYLAQAGVRFVILDANRRIGDSWRNR